MKKQFYKRPWFIILAGIIILSILFGGGDSPEEEPLAAVDQDEVVSVEPIVEEVLEEEPTTIEEAPEPINATAYMIEMGEIHSNMGASLISMSELFGAPQFSDQSWIFDTALEITMIKMYAEEILNMIDVPEAYKEAHFQYANEGATYLYRAMDMLPDAIDNMDADSINTAMVYMETFTSEMNIYLETVTAITLP